MKARMRFLCYIVIALAFISTSLPAQAAGRDCNWLVAGRTYAFESEGFANSGGPQSLNAVGGMVTFLSNGKARGYVNLTVDGSPFGGTIDEEVSSYSFAWNLEQKPAVCTGTATLNGADLPSGNFVVVVSNAGERLEMLHNDAGVTLSFTALLMERGHCGDRTLDGPYSYNAKGWMSKNFVPGGDDRDYSGFVPFEFSGVISFHPKQAPADPTAPKGSALLTGWDNVLLDGVFVPRTYTGWYKVNSDCTSSMVLNDTLGNPPIHTNNYILRGAKGIAVINTDYGFVLSFSAWQAQ